LGKISIYHRYLPFLFCLRQIGGRVEKAENNNLPAAHISRPAVVRFGEHIFMSEKVLKTNHQAGVS
jgi:hypothetical protein